MLDTPRSTRLRSFKIILCLLIFTFLRMIHSTYILRNQRHNVTQIPTPFVVIHSLLYNKCTHLFFTLIDFLYFRIRLTTPTWFLLRITIYWRFVSCSPIILQRMWSIKKCLMPLGAYFASSHKIFRFNFSSVNNN
jgi:hypothetical protein